MKSIKIFATVGAIALLGMTGLSSCNNNPDQPKVPGNYNGETVKTEFAINIPYAGEASDGSVRRMPAAGAQKDNNNFLGMENILLMAYTTPVSNSVAADVTSSSIRLGDVITLTGLQENAITNGKSYYKANVSIPLGTNQFLFYAQGVRPNGGNAFEYGDLNVTNNDDSHQASDIVISPVAIKGSIVTSDLTIGQALADYLTSIARAKETVSSTDYYWSNGGQAESAAFKDLYDTFIGKEGSSYKFIAGSSASIQAMVQDLYTTVKDQPAGIAAAIKTAILASSYVSDSDDDGTLEFTDDLNGYPANLNLPDGSAAIQWDNTVPSGQTLPTGFKIVNTPDWASANNNSSSLNMAPMTSFVYPARIYYYVNSGIKTSTSEQSSKYKNYNDWSALLGALYDGTGNYYVATNTRSIALQKEIQYGVANLETRVRYADSKPENPGKLEDQKGSLIDVSTDNSYLEVTAILVGGQNSVGFDFKAASLGSYVVYDKILTTATGEKSYKLKKAVDANENYTQENTTLLLESPENTPVLVAVELVNKAADFYGIGGQLIPKDTKFYVVAELNAASINATQSPTTPLTKVFKQDYTTKANFTLKTLSKAYNTVPDLRSSQLEIGFSVNLSWQAGNVYDVTIQ